MADSTFETEIRTMITGLLASTPFAMTIRQLQSDFVNIIGENIPFKKLGFNSTEEYLRSIPESVQIAGRGPNAEVRIVVTKKSAHISEMVMKQKVTKKRMPRNRPIFMQQSKQNQNIRYGVETSTPKVVNRPTQPPVYSETKQNNIHNNLKPQNETKKETDRSLNPFQNFLVENQFVQPVQQKQVQHVQLKQLQHIQLKQSQPAQQSLHKTPLKNINQASSSKQLHQINSDFKETANNESQQCTGIRSEILKKVAVVNNAFRKVDGVNTDKIPKVIQVNLKTLISSYPDGLWCSELPEMYKKRFKTSFDYSDYGYKSVIQFCMNLPEIFHYARPSTGDFKLYDRSKPLPVDVVKEFTMASYNLKSKVLGSDPIPQVQLSHYVDLLPKDIVDSNYNLSREFVPIDTKEGDYIDIVIGEIFDLSKFWIYLADNGLDELMDELQYFYGEKSKQYLCPQILLEEGLLCATVFHNEYHRAVVLKVWNDQPDVKVLFLDYGTVCKVPKDSICLLSKRFAELKFQAIRASLANIYPIIENTTWSRRDTQIFLDRVRGRTIVAQINKIYEDKQQLDLYLIDKETGECINELLVKDNVALFTTQERQNKLLNTNFQPNVKYLHLFPTFLELEYGLSPSTADVNMFSTLGITYDLLFPQYFNRKSDEYLISDIEKDHVIFVQHALETYRKRSLFCKLTESNVEILQENASFDMSLFGSLEEEISVLLKKKCRDRKNKKGKLSKPSECVKTFTSDINVSDDSTVLETAKAQENSKANDNNIVEWLEKNLQDNVAEYQTVINQMPSNIESEAKEVNENIVISSKLVEIETSTSSGSSISTLVGDNNKLENEIKPPEIRPDEAKLQDEPEETIECKNVDATELEKTNASEVKCDKNENDESQNSSSVETIPVISNRFVPINSNNNNNDTVYYPWSNFDNQAMQPTNRMLRPPPGFSAAARPQAPVFPYNPYPIPPPIFGPPHMRFGQPICVFQNSFFVPPEPHADFFSAYNRYLYQQPHSFNQNFPPNPHQK